MDTDGFNMDFGKTWIYPTNKQIREYQFNITKEALFKNTMVCLPTGLGKTFIAAVVMYNFFRWYPHGKIIFMAPTKPLVKQQVEACYEIVGIPKEVTAELTGSNSRISRADIWDEKRVFFITPQVLQNDLEIITQLGKQIKCLVFDEAHRARGNHAYCEVMRKVTSVNKYFRVLALTATPGSTVIDVIKVIKDLHIAHFEMRTEDCPDVVPYIFKRNIETIVIPFNGKLLEVKEEYIKILDRYVRVLLKHRVVQDNCSNLTKGKIFYILQEYQKKPNSERIGPYNEIMKTLNICLILYHAFEVLTKHGLRGFLKFFEEHSNKPLLKNNTDIFKLMDDVRNFLGPIPSTDLLPDGTIPDIPDSAKFGHPKFYKLAEIISNFYLVKGQSSKVMVFCEYRESVLEAYTILLKMRPLVKPQIFLGQGAITQKQQMNVIQAFRNGDCNTLISTCIGEEGLDVGEVDLVICFDISNKSSIRMIQRIGRTGRKRDGNVIMLVTEGKEYQLLQESLNYKNLMTNNIMTSKELQKELFRDSPRMVPNNIEPICNKMFITVIKPKTKTKLKNNNIKSMFSNLASSTNSNDNDIVLIECEDRIPESEFFCLKDDMEKKNISCNTFGNNLVKHRKLQSNFGDISHSSNTDILYSLFETAESMRYNIPTTQGNISKKAKSNTFKQSDIRSIFLRSTTQNEIKTAPELNEKYNKNIYDELEIELTNYLSMKSTDNNNCKICDNLFQCEFFTIKNNEFNADDWSEPDLLILETLTKSNLDWYLNKMNPKSMEMENDEFDDFIADYDFTQKEIETLNSQVEMMEQKMSPPINNSGTNNPKENKDEDEDFSLLEAEMCTFEELTSPVINNKSKSFFQLPQSAKKILKEHSFHDDDNFIDVIDTEMETKKKNAETINLSDDDLFENSFKETNKSKNSSPIDIFDSRKEKNVDRKIIKEPISPVLNISISEFQSPILPMNSQNIISQKKLKAQKRLFSQVEKDTPNKEGQKRACLEYEETTPLKESNISKPNLSTLKKPRKGFYQKNTPKKSPKIGLELSDIIGDDFLEGIIRKPEVTERKLKPESIEHKLKPEATEHKLKPEVTEHKLKSEVRKHKLKSEETKHKLKPEANQIFNSPDLFEVQNRNTSHNSDDLFGETSQENSFNKKFVEFQDLCDDSILDLISDGSWKNKSNQGNTHQEKNCVLGTTFTEINDVKKKQQENKSDNKELNQTTILDVVSQENHISSDNVNKTQIKFNDKSSLKSTTQELAEKIQKDIDRDLEDICDVSVLNIFRKPPSQKISNIDEILKKYSSPCEDDKEENDCNTQNISLSEDNINSRNKSPKSTAHSQNFDDLNDFNLDTSMLPKSKKKKTTKLNSTIVIDSDDEFEESPLKSKPGTSGLKQKNSKKNVALNFLDVEAEISADIKVSEDEGSESDQDIFEASFVNDKTENVDDTSILAQYLKSVKSPLQNRKYKIPVLPKTFNRMEIFSQPVDNNNDTYLNDSFCVNSEIIDLTQDNELSELEIAEMLLKEEKRQNKLRKAKTKRKRVYILSDDSD